MSNKISSSFLEAQDTQEILKLLKELPDNSTIFVDIDFTVITPVSKTLINEDTRIPDTVLKPNKDLYCTEEYQEILSNARQRKEMLVDQGWPTIINNLKERHKVYGLTKVDTGEYGIIKSMEEWRHSALEKLYVEFSNDIPQLSRNGSSFYKGIFMTGSSNSKSSTLSYYKEYLFNSSNTLVMIDDKEEELKNIEEFCKENSIKFLGILFQGVEKLDKTINHDVVYLQTKCLLEKKIWFEDDEAEELIKLDPKEWKFTRHSFTPSL